MNSLVNSRMSFCNFITFPVFVLALLLIITGCGGCGGGGGSGSSSSSNGNGSSHSATLTWDAPTTNVDGTPLTDLAGYKVYYGTPSHNYTSVINVGMASCQNSNGKTVCTYTVEGLTPGTYYFAITAYDIEGDMSFYSNEVGKKIE